MDASAIVPQIFPRIAHIPHGLHTGQSTWHTVNPNVSMWVEVLHGWGLEPLAMLGCTVGIDFDRDQFKVLTIPTGDLEVLYGVSSYEVTAYDSLEAHIARQTADGNVVLVDLDAFHLPDMPECYGVRHAAVRVAIDRLDGASRSASYYRQGKRFELTGVDFIGAFDTFSPQRQFDPADVRSIRCVSRSDAPVLAEAVPAFAVQLLRNHLAALPKRQPIAAFREAFHDGLETLSAGGEAYRHAYVYSTLSRLGSHFELLAAHLQWLTEEGYPQPKRAVHASQQIAGESLVCQLRLLRATSRGQIDACEDSLDRIEAHYRVVVDDLQSV